MPRRETIVDIEGRRLSLSNLDKVLYPETGFTKGQVIDYYVRIAPVLIPHLTGRPLTLKRYPNGVTGMFFYEKNCPRHRPEWLSTAPIWSEGNHRWMDYCVVQNLPSLVWAANLASLELHTSLSNASAMPHPSYIVFDLDPGEPATIVQCCQVALWVRDAFTRFGLRSFAKTSGSKGLQVYIPLNSGISYMETKPFAHQLALSLERKHPRLIVSNMDKSLREGKVLIDWSQNDAHKTTVCVYSLRARPHPTVSTPVAWAEVSRCLQSADPAKLEFTAAQVIDRVERRGDLFAPVLALYQQLPPLEAISAPATESVASARSAVSSESVAAAAESPISNSDATAAESPAAESPASKSSATRKPVRPARKRPPTRPPRCAPDRHGSGAPSSTRVLCEFKVGYLAGFHHHLAGTGQSPQPVASTALK